MLNLIAGFLNEGVFLLSLEIFPESTLIVQFDGGGLVHGSNAVHEVAATRRGPEWVVATHDLHTREHSEAQ